MERSERQLDGSIFFPKTSQALADLDPASRGLFCAVLGSPQFVGYAEAVRLNLPPEAGKFAHNGFSREFAGTMFEDLACERARSHLRGRRLVTSPDDTFNIYRSMHPDWSVYNRFGLRNKLGISTPDGLIVSNNKERPRIVGVAEYMLSRDGLDTEKKRQLIGYLDGSVFAGIPHGYVNWSKWLRVLYVVLKNEAVRLSEQLESYRDIYRAKTEVITMPFTRGDFYDVTGCIFEDARRLEVSPAGLFKF